MDPNHNQRRPTNQPNNMRNPAGASGGEQTPVDPDGDAPDGGPRAADRQPQYAGGFTVIPPNESQRSKLKMIAQKEEEALQRWKEANRVPSVHQNPERLGGNVTLAGAREKQLMDLRCSKLQKKLQKEDLDKKKRQEEEEEYQRMKDKQREKAERLEEKRRQEDHRRREQFRQDQARKTEMFLQRFEKAAPGPMASGGAACTSSTSEAAERKPRVESRSERDVQLEHRRVNSAFLDKLEGRGGGSENAVKEGGIQECPRLASEDLRPQPSDPPGHLNPEQSRYDRTAEPDHDWALMKLMSSFPDFGRDFLEDILDQCDGDYQQASIILNCMLN